MNYVEIWEVFLMGTASAKALEAGCAWCVGGTARTLVWLEQSE